MDAQDPHRVELSVSDQAELGSLRKRLSWTAQVDVAPVVGEPGPGELDALALLGSSGRHSLTRMAALLTWPLCGWPTERVTVFRNESGPGDLPDQLVSLFADTHDVALVYYVDHGQIDDDQLRLTLVDSTPNRTAGPRSPANRGRLIL